MHTYLDFSFTKASGGSKNNVTVMQTVHTAYCDGETDVISHTHHYPDLRLSLVIDDTGSMGSELTGVKYALTDFINTHNSEPENVTRGVSYDLVSFKDSPTLRLANTEDANAAISAVNTLSASGGGDCPEDSLGALNLALNNLTGDENSEGEIVLVTDASPRGGDVDGLISQAQGLGVKVNVMLSGDCVASSAASLSTAALAFPILSARDVFQRIANETGGLYFYKPNGTVNDYKKILAEIFETAVTVSDITPPVVTVNATPTMLWPPNHKMIHIDTEVLATDDQDPNPVTKLIGVTLNEPDDGQGDGNTAADI
ncbi:MAG: vWA domain-containing protein, partial [Ignavibacteria bacterium]|nr:vWA domain-containing protein [Ignavibacteria bacterium]